MSAVAKNVVDLSRGRGLPEGDDSILAGVQGLVMGMWAVLEEGIDGAFFDADDFAVGPADIAHYPEQRRIVGGVH